MTNFIFKSQGTYKKLVLKLDIIQSELRHQRVDMANVLSMLNKLLNDKNLQLQVDEYFEDKPSSPTDTETITEENRAYID